MTLPVSKFSAPLDLDYFCQHGVFRPPQHDTQLQQGENVQTDLGYRSAHRQHAVIL